MILYFIIGIIIALTCSVSFLKSIESNNLANIIVAGLMGLICFLFWPIACIVLLFGFLAKLIKGE